MVVTDSQRIEKKPSNTHTQIPKWQKKKEKRKAEAASKWLKSGGGAATSGHHICGQN